MSFAITSTTQAEPAYCGISTLVMCLNAANVDPRQTWKGPWRWYTESMLNCCVDLEVVRENERMRILLPSNLRSDAESLFVSLY
jgi:hypothetical protein